MKIIRKINKLVVRIQSLINSTEYKNNSCVKRTHFTRKRKLTFVDYIIFIIRGSKKSMQLAADAYIKEYKPEVKEYSKQAFSKGRLRIKPEAFLQIFIETVISFYEDNRYSKFKGYRILAIDGTDYNLPNTDELLEKFGSEEYGKNKKTQVQAQGSALYDVLNGVLLDVSISRYDVSERDLAINHMEALTKNNLRTSKDLVLMDRGYPSRKVIGYCEDNDYKYLIRCNKENFLAVIRDVKGEDETVKVQYDEKTYEVRVVTVNIGDITETLLTNLSKEFTVEELVNLYRERWGIETFYKDVKNKMEIENFSGISEIAILQDFYATMALSNFVTAIEFDSQKKVDRLNKDKELKHAYKVNRAMAIGKVKYNLVEMLLEKSTRKRNRILNEIIDELTKRTVAVIPDRNFERRVKHPSQKFPTNRKSVD